MKKVISSLVAFTIVIGMFAVFQVDAKAATQQQALDWARSKLGTDFMIYIF